MGSIGKNSLIKSVVFCSNAIRAIPKKSLNSPLPSLIRLLHSSSPAPKLKLRQSITGTSFRFPHFIFEWCFPIQLLNGTWFWQKFSLVNFETLILLCGRHGVFIVLTVSHSQSLPIVSSSAFHSSSSPSSTFQIQSPKIRAQLLLLPRHNSIRHLAKRPPNYQNQRRSAGEEEIPKP